MVVRVGSALRVGRKDVVVLNLSWVGSCLDASWTWRGDGVWVEGRAGVVISCFFCEGREWECWKVGWCR